MLLVAKCSTVRDITPSTSVSRSAHNHFAKFDTGVFKDIHSASYVIVIGITSHCSLVTGRVFPTAMEVVGHHVVEVNVRINSRKVKVSQFLVTASSRNRNFVVLTSFGTQIVESSIKIAKNKFKVSAVVRTRSVTGLTATAWIFPVKVNYIKEVIGFENTDGFTDKFVSTSLSRICSAKLIRECPAS